MERPGEEKKAEKSNRFVEDKEGLEWDGAGRTNGGGV